MEHLQTFFHIMNLGTNGKPGLIAICISFISATLAFITQIQHIQGILACSASVVAIVSGGFAINYYRLQIRKLKTNG